MKLEMTSESELNPPPHKPYHLLTFQRLLLIVIFEADIH